MEFHLYLPQMRLSFDQLVMRARAAETAGFQGIAGMDHLAPPHAEDQPMYEAMVANTWIGAHTDRMVISSLVLCDSFRHPALLARQAVSVDHATGGRFELGIGWGSVVSEFSTFGVTPIQARQRVQRLRETLEITRALWSGESLDYEGRFFSLSGARMAPVPIHRIPIVIGGVGVKTLALVAEFADWWNLHVGHLDKIEHLRAHVGSARVSIQQMVAYVPDESERDSVTSLALRRFGQSHPVIGSGPQLLEHYGRMAQRGVERVYVWFCDFAAPESLAAFGSEVIAHL